MWLVNAPSDRGGLNLGSRTKVGPGQSLSRLTVRDFVPIKCSSARGLLSLCQCYHKEHSHGVDERLGCLTFLQGCLTFSFPGSVLSLFRLSMTFKSNMGLCIDLVFAFPAKIRALFTTLRCLSRQYPVLRRKQGHWKRPVSTTVALQPDISHHPSQSRDSYEVITDMAVQTPHS